MILSGEARGFRAVVYEAPAKLNWYLSVGRRRPDGYHYVTTVLQTLAAPVDTISLSEADDLTVSCEPDPGVSPEENLAAEAIRALGSAVGREPRIAVRIEKRIPAAAGLGGASSDAAAALVGACELWGMPQLSEIVPSEIMTYQFEARAARQWPSDPEMVKFCARVAAELGVDVFKGYYTGDAATFREVIEYCPIPYVVLSGPAAGDAEGFLHFVKEAIACGAAGVSVGRNVFAHPDPAAMTRALCRVVHEDASVASVLKDLR